MAEEPLPFDLATLVPRLQNGGFKVDTRQYLVAHQLLAALAAHGGRLDSADRLISHLGPIFCTSPEEQERFGSEILQWLGRPIVMSTAPDQKREGRSNAAMMRRRLVVFAALAGAAAMLVAFVIWFQWNGQESVTIPPQAGVTAQPPVAAPPPSIELITAPPPTLQIDWRLVGAGLLLVTGLSFAAAWLFDRARRQLALGRLPASGDPERVTLPVPDTSVQLVAEGTARRAAAALSRPREGSVLDLDVDDTLDETSRAGGFFSPRYAPRRSAQEYIALVNRRGADDHQAAVFDTFLKHLRDRGIALETYSFHDEPQVCYSDETGQGQRLGPLVGVHHRATLIVCADAHLAFHGTTTGLAPWVESTASLDRRVYWTPQPPYRWSRREFSLIDAGFTVIPATDDGWRALIDLDAGWRHDLLFPATYARPFPSVIGPNERRWLDRNEPPVEIADKLVKQVADFLGPKGFSWLCACAVYPEMTWNLTLRVAGDAPDYAALPSLARLPWFRHGFMPDWLRRLLIKRLLPDASDRLRTNLEQLLEDLARRSTAPASIVVRSALHIGRWAGSFRPLQLLRAAPSGSPLRDQVFLGFMARANVEPLWLPVSDRMARLFRRRPRRFGAGVDFGRQRENMWQRIIARLRGWAVFHPDRTRFVQAVFLGVLVILLRTPTKPVTSATAAASTTSTTAASPPIALPPAAAPVTLPPTAAAPIEARPIGGGLQTAPTGAAPIRNEPTAAAPPPAAAAARGATTQAPGLQTVPVRGGVSAAPNASAVAQPPAQPSQAQNNAGAQPSAAQPAVPESRVDSQPTAPSAAPENNPPVGAQTANQNAVEPMQAPPNDDAVIRQLMQNYASALEHLDVGAVAALYPSVNTRTLQTAFSDYRSLQQTIAISRIEIAPNGQTATVVATVTTAPVVKTGRATAQTRTVTYTVRKAGGQWVIDSAR